MSAVAERVELPVWGTTAVLAVTNPAALRQAEFIMRAGLAAVDDACSRFRRDSEVSMLHRVAGRPVVVGPVLGAALDAALEAAEQTAGLVDPTVGSALIALGYDRDFADVADRARVPMTAVPAPGWWRISWVPAIQQVVLPRGIRLDLGATAKALAADWIAAEVVAAVGGGAMVALGGDVAVAGTAPAGGWRIGVGVDHELALADPEVIVTVADGGLATSGTIRRAWRWGDQPVHHIVDPRTGDVAGACWCAVTVAARTCVEANTASTAAVVLGADAPDWLGARGLPARLVGVDGVVVTTPGWPGGEG